MKTDEQTVRSIFASVHDQLVEYTTSALLIASVDGTIVYKILGPNSHAVGLADFLIHEIHNEWDKVVTETLPDEKGDK